MYVYRAPSVLKVFHELAIAVKDAYAAVSAAAAVSGDNDISQVEPSMRAFLANIDFLLALVNEVAVDKITRGALKEDVAFKSVRDVIKKGGKLLESIFLVRREQRHTLYIRIIDENDKQDLKKIESWSMKVDNAVNKAADNTKDKKSEPTSRSRSRSRGRSLIPTAGMIKSRRATPTPSHRSHHTTDSSTAAEDGANVDDVASTPSGVNPLHEKDSQNNSVLKLLEPVTITGNAAKSELSNMIQQLQNEKFANVDTSEALADSSNTFPKWVPIAQLPDNIPRLPLHYVHRHRLMQQVVNSLLDRSSSGPRDCDVENPFPCFVTSITSRHFDKVGNGKSTIAISAIQTVDVRQRFSDGIVWIDFQNRSLDETDVRALYSELYRQLMNNWKLSKSFNNIMNGPIRDVQGDNEIKFDHRLSHSSDDSASAEEEFLSRANLESGSLVGLRQNLGNYIVSKRILLCLDNVQKEEDASWFMFHDEIKVDGRAETINVDDIYPFRILLTSRTARLTTNSVDIQVRILTEVEAIRLLVSSAGRKPYGIKNPSFFEEAKEVVRGCGNSPLAISLQGSYLKQTMHWTRQSSSWKTLLEISRDSYNEASNIRSFSNSLSRMIASFFQSIKDDEMRSAVFHCFLGLSTITCAYPGPTPRSSINCIPENVLLKYFSAISQHLSIHFEATNVLKQLLQLNLLVVVDTADYDISNFLFDDQEQFYLMKYQVRIRYLFVRYHCVFLKKTCFLGCYSWSRYAHRGCHQEGGISNANGPSSNWKTD